MKCTVDVFLEAWKLKCIYYGRNNIEGYCNSLVLPEELFKKEEKKAPSLTIKKTPSFYIPKGLYTTVDICCKNKKHIEHPSQKS